MSGLEDRLVAAREVMGGLVAIPRGLPAADAPRPGLLGAFANRLRTAPGLRQTVVLWLMRGAMMAYLLAVTTAFEQILRLVQRWF